MANDHRPPPPPPKFTGPGSPQDVPPKPGEHGLDPSTLPGPIREELEKPDPVAIDTSAQELKDGLNHCPKCGATDIRHKPGTDLLICAFCRHEWHGERVEEQFGFDEETGAWAVRKGEGYEYASKPEHGRPWMDVGEFVANWAGQDVAKPFLKDQRQRIPGPGQPPASGGSGKTIAASDQAAFLENLKDIASGKVSVAQS